MLSRQNICVAKCTWNIIVHLEAACDDKFDSWYWINSGSWAIPLGSLSNPGVTSLIDVFFCEGEEKNEWKKEGVDQVNHHDRTTFC